MCGMKSRYLFYLISTKMNYKCKIYQKTNQSAKIRSGEEESQNTWKNEGPRSSYHEILPRRI